MTTTPDRRKNPAHPVPAARGAAAPPLLPPPDAARRQAAGRLAGLALAAAGLGLGLAGCATPRVAPVLLTLPQPALTGGEPIALRPDAPALALRRLGLPEYLVARRVRYRADASTLADWPNTFWAERVEVATSRGFASALRAALPGWWICEADCADRTPPQTLQVDFLVLDALRPQGRLVAQLRWQVAEQAPGSALTPRIAREQSFERPLAADTPQAQAQAMAEVLQEAARAVAASLAPDAPGRGQAGT